MIRLSLLWVVGFVTFPLFTFGQGSGNAISFDGTEEYIRIEHDSMLNLTSAWTIEMWLKPDVIPLGSEALIHKCDSATPVSLWLNTSKIEVVYGTGSGSLVATTGVGSITSNEWQHIAVTREVNDTVRIFINGILKASVSSTPVPPTNTEPLYLARQGGGDSFYDGAVDEVRIWNVTRSQEDIRMMMCTKLSGSETGLVSCWRMDEASGTQATDAAGSHNGTLFNTPEREASGVHMGDTSVFLYTNSWLNKSLTLDSPHGDSLNISTVVGNPDGMVLYRVDEMPNSTTGLVGSGSNQHYYGVFKVNGAIATYTMTYHYGGNAAFQLGGVLDSNLTVYTRADNSVSNWTEMLLVLDISNETLTAIGINSEYMLGTKDNNVVLPIELATFKGRLTDQGTVELNWVTATEINNDYFEVERMEQDKTWRVISRMKGAGNSSIVQDYFSYDLDPMPGENIYRLTQVDFNGERETFPAIDVFRPSDDPFSIQYYPNPAIGRVHALSSGPGQLRLYTSLGNLVLVQPISEGNNIIEVGSLKPDMYIVQVEQEQIHHYARLVVSE